MAQLFTSSKYSATNAAGAPLSGGRVYTYIAGTLTPQATYTDQSGTSPNTNPVLLDAVGRASIWLGPYAYRFIVKDASDVVMPDGDVDNITVPTAAVQLTQPTTDPIDGDGVTTVFTLSANPATVNNVFVSLGGAVQVPGDDYTLSGVTLTFVTAPPNGVVGFANYRVALPVGSMGSDSLTYIAPSGGVSRSGQSKFRETLISVMDYGAVGDGSHDDTLAIQTAINYVQSTNAPGTYGSNSPAAGACRLFFPAGYYKVTDTLYITRKIALEGEGQPEYSTGTRIVQFTANKDLFDISPIPSGMSISFEKLSLRGAVGVTGTGDLIRIRKTTAGCNSQRYIGCMFGQPQRGSVAIDYGDDIAFENCLWDVATSGAAQFGVRLGSNTVGEGVSNVRFTNYNFFQQGQCCVKIYSCDGLTMTTGSAYTDGSTRTQYFIDASSATPVLVKNITVNGLTQTYGRSLFSGLSAVNVTLSGITCNLMGIGAGEALSLVQLSGTSSSFTMTGVTAKGAYDTVNFYSDAAATSVTDAVIVGNNFTNLGGVGQAVNCAKTTGRIAGNNYSGFSQASVGGKFTSTGSAFAPGTVATVDENVIGYSVPGALVGDRAFVTPTNGTWPVLKPVTVDAYVSSTNNMTVLYTNASAAGKAVTAHDWVITVER